MIDIGASDEKSSKQTLAVSEDLLTTISFG